MQPCLHMQCAHIMAMAVQRTFKEALVTVGPWTERGFFYDFDVKEPLTDKDLKKIRKEMQKIVRADLPFIREEVRERIIRFLHYCVRIRNPKSDISV